jgi:stage IV sporulation protein FB
LGHIVVASIFKIKVNKITLNIFGFNADIGEINHLSIFKQILIIISGPLTYFISRILIKELYLNDIISLVMYYKAIATNKYILLFNLLPIFPLDGGRLFKLFLDKLLPYKKSKIASVIVSFFFMILFVVYTMECKQYLMYIFLCVSFIVNVITLKKDWKSFLLKRYYFKNSASNFKKNMYFSILKCRNSNNARMFR